MRATNAGRVYSPRGNPWHDDAPIPRASTYTRFCAFVGMDRWLMSAHLGIAAFGAGLGVILAVWGKA